MASVYASTEATPQLEAQIAALEHRLYRAQVAGSVTVIEPMLSAGQVDAVTGLEYPIRENRFLPGIDLLALCWMSAAVLFCGSLIPLQRKQRTTIQ